VKRYKRRLKQVSKIKIKSFETYEEYKMRVLKEVEVAIDRVARSQNIAKTRLETVICVNLLKLNRANNGNS